MMNNHSGRHKSFEPWVLFPVCGRLPKFVVGKETIGPYPAGIGATSMPCSEFFSGLNKDAAAGIHPGQPIRRLESLDVRQPAVLETLQPHATSARHLRHLLERENQQLAIFADRGDKLALDHCQGTRRVGRRDIEHLLALPGIGQAFVLGYDEAATLGAGDQEFAPALVAESGDEIGLLLKVDKQSDRLAMPAPTRKLGSIERVEATIAREHQTL